MTAKIFLERIGWQDYLRPFLFKKLPSRTGWSATLGTLSALLFALLAATGVILAFYYNPSPDKAYLSIEYIMNDVPLGSVVRGLHHWGAGAMVLVVFVHLLSTYFAGTFKAPRELTWVLGVCLFLATLGLGFTGYLLPWDMKAYWATVVSANIPRDIPVIGDAITRIALGGDGVSGLTLTRFYAIHTLLLPALLAIFMVIHIYMVRIHGLSEHVSEKPVTDTSPEDEPLYRFYPEHAWRSSVVFAVVFAVLLVLATGATVPKEQVAGTLIESYLPRPEWYYMWLFQLLTYFTGTWEVVGSLAVPALGIGLVFAVPFLGKSQQPGLARRPLAMALGVTITVCIVYLTMAGFEGARPSGETILIPETKLSAPQARGLFLYVDRDCAYCHQISGKGGHRVGPDLANITAKGKKKEYLAKFVKDPQAVSATSIMPKYDLPEADLNALAEFMLSLDFDKNKAVLLKRDQALSAAAAK